MPNETTSPHPPGWPRRVWRWLAVDFFGIAREMRTDYLPPLMVYLAAGVSGFTGISDVAKCSVERVVSTY